MDCARATYWPTTGEDWGSKLFYLRNQFQTEKTTVKSAVDTGPVLEVKQSSNQRKICLADLLLSTYVNVRVGILNYKGIHHKI